MTVIDKHVSRIEANERSIEGNNRRLIEIHEEQQQRRRDVAAAKEKLVLDLARDAGLLDLSPRGIVQALSGLQVACVAQPAVAALVSAESHSESKDEAGDDGDLQDVAVRISRNASAAKREVLETAGLHWNGRRRRLRRPWRPGRRRAEEFAFTVNGGAASTGGGMWC